MHSIKHMEHGKLNQKEETQMTIKDQIKKFAIKSLYGFQTIILYGMGTRLGIFEYLFTKGKSAGKVEVVAFSLDELAQKLNLDKSYLEAWLHMGLECELFEIDNIEKRTLKTAAFVYDLLINRESMFYIGGNLSTFYLMAPYQNMILENFKSGQKMAFLDMPPQDYQLGQAACAVASRQTEELYAKKFKDHRRNLRNGGTILEVGCGYGYNLELWAKNYKKARIVGIDIDPNGVAHTTEMVKKNGWDNRIEVVQTSINAFTPSHNKEFDLILMNHVLHEMNPDASYRKSVLAELYSMLKDTGLLIVIEHNVPDMFTPKERPLIFEIWHKFFEVSLKSKFYTKEEFQELVADTPFKTAELIEEEINYFWVLKRQ